MRSFLLALAILVFSAAAIAQDFDARLLVKYSKEELTKIQKEDPEQFKFLNDCLTYGYYIADLKGKNPGKEVRGEVELKDLNNVNIFALDLIPEENRYLYYKIKGQDKLLVVRSIGHIKMEANK